MYKLGIVGSRDFPEPELKIREIIDSYKWYADEQFYHTEYGKHKEYPFKVVSGAGGIVDLYAEQYAREQNIDTIIYPAKWRVNGVYNPKAGIERNRLIAEESDGLICFYKGVGYRNSGCLSTVEFMQELGKPWKIISPWSF